MVQIHIKITTFIITTLNPVTFS